MIIFSVVVTVFWSGNSPVQAAASAVVSPFQKLFTGVKNVVVSFFDARANYDELLAENESLKEQLAEAKALSREAAELTEENESLRALLDMRQRNSELELTTAQIIAWSDIGWSSSFTINQGSGAGVSVGDCVMVSEGLVGAVTRVEANYSEVGTLIDTASSFSALLPRSQITCQAAGEFKAMGKGLFRLSLIPLGGDVKVGDEVVTSGLSGLCPSNLLLGTVTEVGPEPGGMTEYALVEPAAELATLKQVFVVTDFTD